MPEKSSLAMSSTLRCFRVLELLAEEPFELGVAEVAKRLSVPRATAHRLCVTLRDAGFIESARAEKRYHLTPKSLWVGSGYLRHSAVYRAAFFPMQTLVERIPYPTQLGVLLEEKVLFIHSLGGSKVTDAFADIGLRREIHATATGKLFLAEMPPSEVKRIMLNGAVKLTPRTITTLARMEQDLEQTVAQGYAVNDEELLEGYVAIAAPVRDATQRTVAAISITAPAERVHAAGSSEIVGPLCEAARKASLVLGYNHRAANPPRESLKTAPIRGHSGRTFSESLLKNAQ